ncbi:MAG: hypothetical protein AAFU61_04955, partial [Pseudomonadota bacterium]
QGREAGRAHGGARGPQADHHVVHDGLAHGGHGLQVAELLVVGGPEEDADWPAPLDDLIAEAAEDAIDALPKKRRDDEAVEEAASRAARRIASRRWGKKPTVTVLVTRLED